MLLGIGGLHSISSLRFFKVGDMYTLCENVVKLWQQLNNSRCVTCDLKLACQSLRSLRNFHGKTGGANGRTGDFLKWPVYVSKEICTGFFVDVYDEQGVIEMLATDQFKMRIEPEVKKILSSLASREGRSQANMIKTLIIREYQAVKAAESTKKEREHVKVK